MLSFIFLANPLVVITASHSNNTLEQGNSLHVEKPGDVLVSANGVFSAGFFPVGENAYCFAVWMANHTPVWMANRDQPVNGRASTLSLEKNGKLILTDAGKQITSSWTTGDYSVQVAVQLRLLDNGNLVLLETTGKFIWQSFDFPTDTLLPGQVLTKDTYLISSRSRTNFSSGNYKLFFDNDNTLRLLYQVPDVTSSIYWPRPWSTVWENGRTLYNSSRVAVLNSLGYFNSSDNFLFRTSDSGLVLQRRMTLDPDGNLRVYSLQFGYGWVVSWQSWGEGCRVHGICGENSLCEYDPVSGRECSCLPGYRMRNPYDWSRGCEKEFRDSSCDGTTTEVGFFKLRHVEFYGYDLGLFENSTLQRCKEQCKKLCCDGFQFKFDVSKGTHICFPKSLLLNGCRTPGFPGDFYLKLPKSSLQQQYSDKEATWPRWQGCSSSKKLVYLLDREYERSKENASLNFLLKFSIVVGILESISIFLVWFVLFRSDEGNKAAQGYIETATRFRRYTFSELKKATKNFTEEIGRGGGGVVYRGVLPDQQRIAAIKRLHGGGGGGGGGQGEAEFLAEVTSIARLNHMNLIEMWGYCVQGKHRLLVYEYMEHGSLADNLSKTALNWGKRFNIAVSTAKGLAYLHEECLEWILHCDIKPQNILLDTNFNSKVADFGLSKLINRSGNNNSSFSGIRGTRGYIAPEWVYNLPITSKVDVYSYGIVVLEMVTGKCPTAVQERLVPWVREKISAATTRETWIEEIADPTLENNYDMNEMELLVQVALECVKEDMYSRPTMNQVVEMLSINKCEDSEIMEQG